MLPSPLCLSDLSMGARLFPALAPALDSLINAGQHPDLFVAIAWFRGDRQRIDDLPATQRWAGTVASQVMAIRAAYDLASAEIYPEDCRHPWHKRIRAANDILRRLGLHRKGRMPSLDVVAGLICDDVLSSESDACGLRLPPEDLMKMPPESQAPGPLHRHNGQPFENDTIVPWGDMRMYRPVLLPAPAPEEDASAEIVLEIAADALSRPAETIVRIREFLRREARSGSDLGRRLTKCDVRWKTDAAAFKMLDALDAAQRHTDKTAIDVPKGASAHERMALAMNPFLTKLKRTCGPGRIWFRRHGAFTAVLAQEAGCLLLPNPAETNDAPSEIASKHTHDSSEQAS